MKKSLFSLGEIIPSNNNKNRKGMNIAKTKEKENKKIQQFYINKNKKKSIQKQLKQDINLNYNSKTPIKISGKTKLLMNVIKIIIIIIFYLLLLMENKFFFWNFF